MQNSRKRKPTSIFKSAGVAAVLAAVAVISGLVTFAYLTDSERTQNTLTVGTNEITIVEDYDPPELEKGVNAFKKKIQVKNTGNTDAFVRVFVAFSDSKVRDVSGFQAADGVYYSANPEGVTGGVTHPDASDPETTVVEINESPYIDHLPEDWVYIPEGAASDTTGELGGYFYYTKPIAPNASTTALTERIMTYFATDDDVVAYEIPVYAESVQIFDHNGNKLTGTDAWKRGWEDFLGRKKLGASEP